MRESCISHAPKVRSVVIKSDYLQICENDHCEAALLSLVEFWANGVLANHTNPPVQVELGQFTSKDLHWWLLGFYSTKRIMQRIDKLQSRGFIRFEESANHKQRRYWAHIDAIQSALNESRQMSLDKCPDDDYPRQMSRHTPDKCLDKTDLPQTNVSTSIFSNSSLSNEELVTPLTPQGENQDLCVSEESHLGKALNNSKEASDTSSPSLTQKAEVTSRNEDTDEIKDSAAPRDNSATNANQYIASSVAKQEARFQQKGLDPWLDSPGLNGWKQEFLEFYGDYLSTTPRYLKTLERPATIGDAKNSLIELTRTEEGRCKIRNHWDNYQASLHQANSQRQPIQHQAASDTLYMQRKPIKLSGKR